MPDYGTDAHGKKLTVETANALSIERQIAAVDAADGNAISGKFAKFKPTAAGTYVFKYTHSNSKKYYKVIKVVNN